MLYGSVAALGAVTLMTKSQFVPATSYVLAETNPVFKNL